MRPFLVLATICVVAGAAAPGVLAGQPSTQTLVPPPPAFETCKAVGNGTLCEGSIASSYGPVDTGSVCGSGPGAFDVFDSASENEVARRVYDATGLLVRRDRHDRSVGQLSNQAAGTSLAYTQEQEITDELAVPGDLSSATRTITGQFHLRADGGAPVLIGAGRVVFDPAGTLEFQAGPTGFLDLVSGNPAVVQRVCAALEG